MAKYKIALYTQTFPPKGGGVSTSHYNIYNLLKEDFDIKVLAFNEKVGSRDTNVIKLSNIGWLHNVMMWFIKLKFKAKKNQSSLSNVNAIVSSFIPILKANRQLKQFQPDIILVPDFNVPLYLLKKPVNSTIICVAHHNYSRFKNHILLENKDWLDLDIAYSMEKKAMKKVDAIISPSHYMIEKFKATTYKNKDVFRVPNFMEAQVFDSIAKKAINNQQLPRYKKIIYIPSAGSVVKGKRYVFEIVRRLRKFDRDVFFYLSGHIPEDLVYELQAFKDHIYMPGHVPWENNVIYMMQSYMGMTPNLEENFSNAILEGQAAGLPFIAFDTGGNKEIILDHETGFIVPYLDIEALIDRAKQLLKDNNLREAYSKTSKESCYNRFNNRVIKAEYRKVFSKIMGS